MDNKEKIDKYTKLNLFDYVSITIGIFALIFIFIWYLSDLNSIHLEDCQYSINQYSTVEEIDIIIQEDKNVNEVNTKTGSVQLTNEEIAKYIYNNNQVIVDNCEFTLYINNPSGTDYMVKEFEVIKKYPWEKGSLDGFKEDITIQTKELIENVKFNKFNYNYILQEKDVENLQLYSFEE